VTTRWRVAALTVAVLSGATGADRPRTVAAQSVDGVVLGMGKGPGGEDAPIAGARVILFGDGATPIDSTVTDPAGRFRLPLPGPGAYAFVVQLDGYLTVSETIDARDRSAVRSRVVMPLVSAAAAETMRYAIERESALSLPFEELCGEPPRPWEAGIIIGVTRDRRTLEPVPSIPVELVPDGGEPRVRISTDSGAFWFCNVIAGEVRITSRAPGLPPDTFRAVVRAGAISWYDALIGGRR
jgi:hypothetical protein